MKMRYSLPMEKEDLYLVLGGTFLIGAGLGFYIARLIFGS